MQIIVLGMHRAGTSAITRLINLMGAYLAPEEQLLPATLDNPRGYWERIDLLKLHEWLLDRLGADWHLTSRIDLTRIDPELHETFRQRAGLILDDLDAHPVWVMKDPRLCLLLPLWRPLLKTPVCVHIVRHPLATAQSLAKRDDFPLHFGLALWEHYMACALRASAGLPRFAISYEALMAQPAATVQMLYDHLGTSGMPNLHLPDASAIQDFLTSDLQHHRVDEEDAQWLTPRQRRLWETLRDSRLADLDPDLLEDDPGQLEHLSGYEALLQELGELRQRDTGLGDVWKQLADGQSRIQQQEALIQQQEALIQQQDTLLHKNAADLQSLTRLFEVLHHDTQLAFASLTWRTGFAIAETGRKLGLLPRTFLVQDHIAHIARNYQAWRRRVATGEGLSVRGQGSAIDSDTFDEAAYLAQYPDVRAAVDRSEFRSGREHFELRGREEIASGSRLHIPDLPFRNGMYPEAVNPQQARLDIARWARRPLISIIMPVYNVESRWLDAAIQSVMQQIYPHWELCIADDGSTRQDTLATLRQWEMQQGKLQDARFRIVFLSGNQGIAGASNAALALATGEYAAFLDHDDELTVDALYHVVKAVNDHNPDLIYSDEDKLSLEGYHLEPHFKPDYSPDLILSTNYICHLSVYRKTLLDRTAADGDYVRSGFEGSQDHDLVLRALEHADRVHHIPRVLYHWRMIPGSTAARYDSKNHAWDAGRRAVEEALQRRGIAGKALPGHYPGTYRVQRTLQGQPLISIIIPFRDQPDLLRLCLDSILEKTTYPQFELLGISNHSVEPETFAVMAHYAAGDRRLRFLRYDQPFNYAAINNFAAAEAVGEHLLLLNNDMTVITPDWLEALLEHSQRPEVGAVGAKLHYPDDTVQHGGVIVGVGGIAGHAHKNFPRHHPGYFTRLSLIQNLSAVTAACLMVKKSLYVTVDGLDEQHLAVAFNDVDFCLRLREEGYLNVFTPYCELYHHESRTRGYEDTPEKQQRFIREIAYMRKRHAAILQNGDPYYNPNLPLDRDDFGML